MNVIVSLFDESGNMVRPWAEVGYECHCFDMLNYAKSRETFPNGGSITYHHADLLHPGWVAYIKSLKPYAIFGFPPCTDLAVSGSRHFASKARENPDFQKDAVALCMIVPDTAAACECELWFMEQPISMLSSLYRKPDYYFDPNEYGGYLPEDDVHPRWPQYIPPRDAYTKKTSIWAGRKFVMPDKIHVPPIIVEYENGVRGSPAFSKLGGKSAKTKRIRAETPRGYAAATLLANM